MTKLSAIPAIIGGAIACYGGLLMLVGGIQSFSVASFILFGNRD